MSSTRGTWSLQWGYDRLGNRLSQTLVGGNVSIGQPQLVIDQNTNRITNSGYQYDAAGNMTNDSVSAYTYDGANRLTKINSGPPTYTYFGALRIKKVVGSTTTVYVYSGSKPIVEYVNGSLSKEYIYAGSQLLATRAGSATTYHHPDHLSNRAETDASGNVTPTFGHFPFGEIWYETGTANKWKFTSYENDSGTGETGLNYAQFRYSSPGQGRFMSADFSQGSRGRPQSLNRYSYVGNDPINLVDPQGLFYSTAELLESGDEDESDGGGGDFFFWFWPGGGGGGGFGGGDGGGGGGGSDPTRKDIRVTIRGPVLDCSPPDSPTHSEDDLNAVPTITVSAVDTKAGADVTGVSGTATIRPSSPGESSSNDSAFGLLAFNRNGDVQGPTTSTSLQHIPQPNGLPNGGAGAAFVAYVSGNVEPKPNGDQGWYKGYIDLSVSVTVGYTGSVFGFNHEATFDFNVSVKIQCAHSPEQVANSGGQ